MIKHEEGYGHYVELPGVFAPTRIPVEVYEAKPAQFAAMGALFAIIAAAPFIILKK